jgi:branched-chain amino acid aminotransferase
MAMLHYLINGQPVLANDAQLHVSDLALLRGYGLFDYFRVLQGTPLFLDDYLERFFRSARHLHLTPPVEAAALRDQLRHLLTLNRTRDAGIKIVLTGGYSPDGFTPGEPNLILMQQDLPVYDPKLFREGISLMTCPYVRELPDVKSTNYLKVLSLRPKLREAGAADVLYYDGTHISESSRSNLFIVDPEGIIRTPSRNILRGVTRKHVLELARQNFDAVEEDVTLEQVRNAREVFMTSSTKGVMPVTLIDGQAVGNGLPGEVARVLQEAFEVHVEAYIEARSGTRVS